MKVPNHRLYIIAGALLFLGLAIAPAAKTQSVPFTQGLSIKGGAGLSTFYGEMSPAGLSVLKNTKAGFSGSIIKMLNPVFGIQAQYTGAGIYSERDDYGMYFSGFVNEIGLSARLELLQIFSPGAQTRISPYLRAGIASTRFRSVRRDVGTNTIYLPAYGYQNDGLTKTAAQNALSIPVGIGLSFRLTDQIFIEAEHAMSITNSDVLDSFVGTSSPNDMFGMTQLGIKFTISPVQTTERKVRNDKPASRTRTNRREKPEEENINVSGTNILVQSLIPEKPVSGKIFEVKIRLNKEDYTEKAVLTQSYPKGFTAMESQVSDAIFSFVDQKVKIIWDQLPKEPVVEYTYLVRPSESTRGSYTVNGSLEYKQSTGPKIVHFANYLDVANQIESNMDSRILDLLGENKQEEQTKKVEENQTQDDQMGLKIEDLLRKYGGETQEERSENVQTDNKVADNQAQPAIVKGTEFRIQIGAFRDKDQGRAIIRRYNLPETVTEEFVDGLYKYTLGSFKSYNDAVRFRDSFIKRTRIYSAFIVAYQDGKRVKNLNDLIK